MGLGEDVAQSVSHHLHKQLAQAALRADGAHTAHNALLLVIFDKRHDHACCTCSLIVPCIITDLRSTIALCFSPPASSPSLPSECYALSALSASCCFAALFRRSRLSSHAHAVCAVR